MSELPPLNGQSVRFTLPNGKQIPFRVTETVPVGTDLYAVLEEEGGSGQLIVALVIGSGEELSFMVVQDEEMITAVFEQVTARAISRLMENTPEEDPGEDPDGDDDACDDDCVCHGEE